MIWLLVVAGAAVLFGLGLVARRRYVAVAVHGPSMEPALRHGDRVIVRRTRPDRIRPGQIVVFRNPPPWRRVDGWQGGRLLPETGHWSAQGPPRRGPQWTIKRVAAVPGDPLPAELADHTAELGSIVPAGSVAVLGDNRSRSFDSRQFGYIAAAEIIGVLNT